jgi:hypothetical protein
MQGSHGRRAPAQVQLSTGLDLPVVVAGEQAMEDDTFRSLWLRRKPLYEYLGSMRLCQTTVSPAVLRDPWQVRTEHALEQGVHIGNELRFLLRAYLFPDGINGMRFACLPLDAPIH